MSEESKDCLACRLMSGGGLIFGGAYIIYHSKNAKKPSRIIAGIGYGLSMLGILRIFSLPPFRKPLVQKDDKVGENIEQSDYIIGKYPTKFH